MARWVLSPIIGDGSDTIVAGQEATTGPYRPSAAQYATDWSVLIPGNADGTPVFPWCLVRAIAGDLTAAEADPDLTVFPDLALNDVLTAGQRNWLITKIGNLGKPTGWIVPGITVREVLRTIGRYLEANFEITWLGEGG